MKSITQISITNQILIFALSLITLRIFKVENIGVLFLLWNLFLAWLPLFFIQQMDVFKSNYWKFSILFLTILFLPNSIYIFTDIFHLKKNLAAPIWYDLVLFLTFSILGMIYFSKTLKLIMENLRLFIFKEQNLKLIKISLIFLCSFGVYLGRFLRLNSWDLFTKPTYIFEKMNESFQDGKFLEIVQVTFIFGIFIYFINEILEKKIEN